MRYVFSVLLVTVSFIVLTSCKESAVEPAEQFVQVHFKYGFKNELNTFENIYQKDLIEDGTAQTDFWLTAEEQNNILTKANEAGYFSMPARFEYTSDDGTAVTSDPNPGEQKLRIRHKETDKTVTWTYPVSSENPQFNKLTKLADYIKSVIEAKSEYKNLPPHAVHIYNSGGDISIKTKALRPANRSSLKQEYAYEMLKNNFSC